MGSYIRLNFPEIAQQIWPLTFSEDLSYFLQVPLCNPLLRLIIVGVRVKWRIYEGKLPE